MKYNYSKEKAKEVLKKYAEGGKVNAGTYRVGNPIKVGNMYEQKVAIISSNGDIRSNSEFGMTKTDFISMKYPKISEKKFYSLSNYAEGGSLGNHGLKHGDQIIKTMAGGVQKVKTKTGDIVYVNLANGYRGAEPPLPFAKGGGVKMNTEVILSENRPNGAEWQGVVKPFMLKSIEENQYAGGFKRYEIDIYDEVKREPTKEEIKKANEFFDKIGGRYASGGGVRKVGNREYSTGRNWTNDHLHVNKSEQHEVNYNRRNSLFFAGGGEIRRFDRQAQMDSETREEILDVLSESDTPKVLTNYLYGLFDGYDYSETANFKKEVEFLKRKNPKLHQRVVDIYKKIDKYKFEKYQDNYATGGVTKNYINRNQLNTITIKKGDQKLTYKVSDVYNGAYKLEDGGKLEKLAFYVPKRNVIKVQLRDGKDVKVANGYWIKKGAKPIHTSKYDDGGFMADVYANGGVIGKEMTFYRHGEEEKGIIGEVNEDGSYNVSTKYSIILVEPQDVISIKDSTKKKGFFFDNGGSIERRYNTMSKEDKEELMREKIGVGRTPFSQYRKYNQLSNYHKNLVDKYFSGKLNYAGGGKTTFNDKATAIAKNFEGKKVEPKYQKEYGKTYNKAEAKEVGNKIAGSQKAKYDSKMSGGGTTKRGGSMQLAKQIRKEGESWGSAIKRANEQIRNK